MKLLIQMALLLLSLATVGCQPELIPIQQQGGIRDDSVVDIDIPDKPSSFDDSDKDEIKNIGSNNKEQLQYIPATGTDQSFPSTKIGCNNSGVDFVRADIDPKKPNTNYYRFHYQHIQKDPELPTFIFIQGGPGGDGIVSLESYQELFPANLVLLDPRGLGCNVYNGAFNEFVDDMSSINYAHDIIQVIKKLKLNQYIVVGSSYGTKVATMLSHFTEKYDMVPPSTVILSGIMGVHEFTTKSYYHFFQQVWNTIVSFPIFNLLTTATRNLIQVVRFYPQALADIIVNRMRGNIIGLMQEVMYLGNLDNINTNSFEYQQRLADFTGESYTGPPPVEVIGADLVYFHITCRERPRTEIDNVTFDLNGQLQLIRQPEDRSCDTEYRGVRNELYTPADYPVKSPVVYFQGTLDPATTLEWAETHYEAQSRVHGDKHFLRVESGGHGTIFSELAECREELMVQIMKQNYDFSNILDDSNNCKN